MRLLIALFSLTLLITGCATPSLDSSQDIEGGYGGVGKWAYTGSHDFEPTQKGAGTSKSYKNHFGIATSYRYTAGRTDWTTSDADMLAMLKPSLVDIMQSYKSDGITATYQIFTKQDGSRIVIKEKPLTYLRFELKNKNGMKGTSYLFMTADAGEILKYRISFNAGHKTIHDQLVEAFVKNSLPNPVVATPAEVKN